MKKKIFISAITLIVFVICSIGLIACSNGGEEHNHIWSEWTFDNATTHSRSCDCGESETKAHSMVNSVCTDCGYTDKTSDEHNHIWSKWTFDNATTHAFSNCSSLKEIIIPEGVNTLGNSTFYGCTNLENVVIPNSISSAGNYCFDGCNNIQSISAPSYAFGIFPLSNLKTATITGGTEIYDNTFKYCTLIEEIIIAKSITIIGNSAFYGCSRLSQIDIPDKAISIGDSAFYDCIGLTEIEIPNTVESIGNNAFYGCNNLKKITLPFVGCSKNTETYSYDSVFGYIFGYKLVIGNSTVDDATFQIGEQRGTTAYKYYYYIPSGLQTVVLNSDINKISSAAFNNCGNLENVVLSNNISTIPDRLFKDCINLKSVTIPNSVLSIDNYAFENCLSLESIAIPNGITTISSSAFTGCSGLTRVNISDLASWCNIVFASVSANPLYYAHNLYLNGNLVSNLIIPDNITTIKDYIFSSSNITSVTISNKVVSIGNSAFYNCTLLDRIDFGSTVSKIGISAFSGCSGLKNITIPYNITEVGSCAFENCSELTQISISDGLTEIGNNIFNGCEKVVSVTTPTIAASQIPKNVLATVIITSGTIIANNSFENSKNLTDIQLSESITAIGSSAFKNCNLLNKINLPNNIKEIGNSAFENCISLTNIAIPNSTVTIGPFAFNGCSGLINLIIGNGVKTIGSSAFSDCRSLINIEVPNSVTSIGGSAFSGCNALKNLTLPFAGGGASSNNGYDEVFGYIFGYFTRTFDNDYIYGGNSIPVKWNNGTQQYHSSGLSITGKYIYTYYYYNIPSSLEKVIISGDKNGGFVNCDWFEVNYK